MTTIGISDGMIISRCAARVTMSTHWPYSGCSVPSMMPGFSRNWRRTSSTTAPPARPTASIESAANRQTIMPPISRPISTSASSSRKAIAACGLSTCSSASSSILKAANSTSAASAAEPIA